MNRVDGGRVRTAAIFTVVPSFVAYPSAVWAAAHHLPEVQWVLFSFALGFAFNFAARPWRHDYVDRLRALVR